MRKKRIKEISSACACIRTWRMWRSSSLNAALVSASIYQRTNGASLSLATADHGRHAAAGTLKSAAPSVAQPCQSASLSRDSHAACVAEYQCRHFRARSAHSSSRVGRMANYVSRRALMLWKADDELSSSSVAREPVTTDQFSQETKPHFADFGRWRPPPRPALPTSQATDSDRLQLNRADRSHRSATAAENSPMSMPPLASASHRSNSSSLKLFAPLSTIFNERSAL